MRWYHKLGLTLVDKLILALALFFVTLSVTDGLTQIGWNLFWIILVVVIAYIGVVIFTSCVTWFFRTEVKGGDFVKGLVSALLILLLYPRVLSILFWLVGAGGISNLVETVLLWTFVIRAGLGAYLGRRWKQIGD